MKTKRKSSNLPKGTFTVEGNPTIVLEIIGIKVAKAFKDKTPINKITSLEFASEVTKCLDSLFLLPNNLLQEEKIKKIQMQIMWMVSKQEQVKQSQIHVISACKRAFQKGKKQLKFEKLS